MTSVYKQNTSLTKNGEILMKLVFNKFTKNPPIESENRPSQKYMTQKEFESLVYRFC